MRDPSIEIGTREARSLRGLRQYENSGSVQLAGSPNA